MKKIYNSNWLFKLKSAAVLFSMLFAGSAMAQLSGSYTIDAGGGGDFTSFNELADTLLSDGVSGAVTVDVVANSGPYNEDFVLDQEITGASSSNTITINGNGETITDNGTVIELEETDFISFYDLVVEYTGTNASTRIFYAHDGTTDIVIDGCEFIARNSNAYAGYPSYYQGCYIWFGNHNFSYQTPSDENNNITINDCKLWKGSTNLNGRGLNHGIVLANTTAATDDMDNVITNNEISDIGQYGMYLRYASGTVVENNWIHNENNNSSTYCYGIYLYNYFYSADEESTVEHNQIYDLMLNRSYIYGSCYGIYLYSGYGSSSFEVNNNSLKLESRYYVIGVYVVGYSGSGTINIRYNSIHMDGDVGYQYARHYGIGVLSHSGGGNVENNIIEDATRNWTAGNGGAYLIYNQNSSMTYDHNNLYNDKMQGSAINSTKWFAYDNSNLADLAAWQNASGGANSISVDPVFTDMSIPDMTPQSIAMANKGTPVAVTVDQTYSARSATTPDLGAYEYFVDVEVVSIDMTGGTECAPYIEDVVVTIQNNGPNDLNGVPMEYSINGGNAVVETTPSIASGATLQYTFAAPARLFGSTTHDITVQVSGDDDVPTNSSDMYSITTTASPNWW